MKDGAINHRKMKRLARALSIPLPYANGIMERLWHAAEDYAPDGAIGTSTNTEIAEYCGMPYDFSPDTLITALVESGFLDEHLEHRLLIHDWPDHCTHYIHNRLARAHQNFADGTLPTLTRLPKKDRGLAEEYYQNSKKRAESSQVRGSNPVFQNPTNSLGRALQEPKRALGERSASAQIWGKRVLVRARPTPTPTPTPSTTEASSVIQESSAHNSARELSNGTWKTDPAFLRFTTDYLTIAQHFIDEDFADAYDHVWKRLAIAERIERVKSLSLHFDEYRSEPRFVPAPRKFLEKEWKRPLKPAAHTKESATTKAKRKFEEQQHARR